MSRIISNKKVTKEYLKDGTIIVHDLADDDIILEPSDYLLTDNNYLFWFGEGNIDEWCVYCVKPNNRTWFAYDSEYLSWIKKMGKFHGEQKVYDSFCRIFDNVHYNFNMGDGYNIVCEVSKDYHRTGHFWAWFWMTMIAEERKDNAILGKRIKRLGVYNMLFDKYKLGYVTQYMVGKKWYELEALMDERGI